MNKKTATAYDQHKEGFKFYETCLIEYLETQKQGLLKVADEFTREQKDQKSVDYCLAQIAFIEQITNEFIDKPLFQGVLIPPPRSIISQKL